MILYLYIYTTPRMNVLVKYLLHWQISHNSTVISEWRRCYSTFLHRCWKEWNSHGNGTWTWLYLPCSWQDKEKLSTLQIFAHRCQDNEWGRSYQIAQCKQCFDKCFATKGWMCDTMNWCYIATVTPCKHYLDITKGTQVHCLENNKYYNC